MTEASPTDPAKFALGTAQLGLPYGRTNRQGMLDDAAAVSLVQTAIRRGVRALDTAGAYGSSERRIGNALRELAGNEGVRVITKVSIGPEGRANARVAREAARDSVERSLRDLGLASVDGVLLHDPADYALFDGVAVEELEAFRSEGRTGKLGVSLNEPHDAADLMRDPRLEVLQIPLNIIDRRWQDFSGQLARRGAHEIFARSAFLQGVLTAPPDCWPPVAGVDPEDLTAALGGLAADLRRDGIDDLCIAYLRGQRWIDWIVLGVETHDQLARNLDLFERPPLGRAEIAHVQKALPEVPQQLLKPWAWAKP